MTGMATSTPISTLDAWIAGRIGVTGELTREELRSWQLDKVRDTLERVLEKCPLYQERLNQARVKDVRSLDDLGELPFTTAEDISNHGERMLCVSQDRVARIMTMQTSGTTGSPKRVFFSDADLERTIDFFHHGMGGLMDPDDSVLILLPGRTPDSTGDLLARGVARMDARGIVHGLVRDPRQALERARETGAVCMVGFPLQLLAMARMAEREGISLPLRSVLLCSDYIPESVCRELRRIWGCRVFSHYGTVETGLGGGVECAALQGCHLREADMYFEIVDPATGTPLEEGSWGEIVFTTLCREAMPLIRYRTGDQGRLIPGTCACGSVVRRLDKVRGRISGMLHEFGDTPLDMAMLDEALLDIPNIIDYSAWLERGHGARQPDVLHVRLEACPGQERSALESGQERLQRALGGLSLNVNVSAIPWRPEDVAIGKRVLQDKRKQG